MIKHSKYRALLSGIALSMFCLVASSAVIAADPGTPSPGIKGDKGCHGMSGGIIDVFNATDWDNAFPITFFGFDIGGGDNPPRLHEDAFCKCQWRLPGLSAIPFGIGLTFWNPLYMVDTSAKSQCFKTMPMLNGALSGYEAQSSGKGTHSGSSGGGQRRQIHFFVFPIFKILDLFAEVFCSGGNKGFDLAYTTEIDPTWQNDLWAATFFPEAGLFANVPSRLACMVEAVRINVMRSFPIDAMWWCLGAHHLYPVSGNSNVSKAAEDTNMKALGRFLYKQHRTFFLSTKIGSGAKCHSTYSPRLPKQQYRVDPLFPSSLDNINKPIVLGRKYLFWKFPPPVMNYPTHEGSAFLLWSGTQCCLRL